MQNIYLAITWNDSHKWRRQLSGAKWVAMNSAHAAAARNSSIVVWGFLKSSSPLPPIMPVRQNLADQFL